MQLRQHFSSFILNAAKYFKALKIQLAVFLRKQNFFRRNCFKRFFNAV
jgi:hypothetical protein